MQGTSSLQIVCSLLCSNLQGSFFFVFWRTSVKKCFVLCLASSLNIIRQCSRLAGLWQLVISSSNYRKLLSDFDKGTEATGFNWCQLKCQKHVHRPTGSSSPTTGQLEPSCVTPPHVWAKQDGCCPQTLSSLEPPRTSDLFFPLCLGRAESESTRSAFRKNKTYIYPLWTSYCGEIVRVQAEKHLSATCAG